MAQRTAWVRLMTVPGQAEAELWRSLLAEEHIVTLIQPNDASAYLGTQSYCHVLVPAEDAARATELAREWNVAEQLDGLGTAVD